MPRILILNGPNINLVGSREPDVYGHRRFDAFFAELREVYAPTAELSHVQSNVEGELVDAIQAADGTVGGIVLNAAGYTHTSVAIRDAIAAVSVPVVEVHISNPAAREDFRHVSLLAPVVVGSIAGFGLESYVLGVDAVLGLLTR
mgnify:CR=1 FL=1